MASGGYRARAGRPVDPGSLRSMQRGGGAALVQLPASFSGKVPDFPFMNHTKFELALWSELWKLPQAFMWDQMNMKFQVAAYVRSFLESVEPGASAGLKTAVLRMETELGLSIAGLRQNGWQLQTVSAEVESGAKSRGGPKVGSARERLKAIDGGQ